MTKRKMKVTKRGSSRVFTHEPDDPPSSRLPASFNN
jgi:hypothetical protein